MRFCLSNCVYDVLSEDIDELKEQALQAWAELPQRKIDAICRHFRTRVKEVRTNGGE